MDAGRASDARGVEDIPVDVSGTTTAVVHAPLGPTAVAEPLDRRIFVASQRQLMWWKFRKHRLALVSALVILLIYLVALFAEPLAPYAPDYYNPTRTYAPPQGLHVFDGGRFVGPYAYGLKQQLDPVALRRVFTVDPEKKVPLAFFVRGQPYRLWGLLDAELHLVGTADREERVYLLGADRLGRDVLSRLLYGTRISMSIGLVAKSRP